MSFYKTEKFKKLKEDWYKKLEESGFDDAESHKNGKDYMRVWHSSYFQSKYTPGAFEMKEEYYRMASLFLETHKFESDHEQNVWMLHTEGKSIRKIAAQLKTDKEGIDNSIRKVFQALKRLTAVMKRGISDK